MSQIWSHTTFTELFKQSPRKAFEFRYEALGTPIPEEYADVTESEPTETEARVTEKPDSVEEEGFTAAELRAKLRDAGVKFSNASPIDALAEKCRENNLI